MNILETIQQELKRLKRTIGAYQIYNGVKVDSGDAVRTQFSIVHGLRNVTEDSFVSVIPKSDAASIINFNVTIDDVEITITYDTAPDDGVDNLKWIYMIKP